MNLDDPLLKRALHGFCHKWHIRELAVFGSVLTSRFSPASDVDVLVSFSDETPLNIRSLHAMQSELEQIFGRNVDMVSRTAIERSRNPIRRELILGQSRVLAAA